MGPGNPIQSDFTEATKQRNDFIRQVASRIFVTHTDAKFAVDCAEELANELGDRGYL